MQNSKGSTVVEADLSFRRVINELDSLYCKDEQHEVENFLYVLETEDNHYEICVHNEPEDELQSIELFDWKDIACMEIKSALELSKQELAAEILWSITAWGDNNQEIQAILKDIQATVKKLTS